MLNSLHDLDRFTVKASTSHVRVDKVSSLASQNSQKLLTESWTETTILFDDYVDKCYRD